MNLRVFFTEYARGALRNPQQFRTKRAISTCPICGFSGRFLAVGPRPEARCPNCSSKERDRIMGLYLSKLGMQMEDKRILHFSPERPFFMKWKNIVGYVAGDVKKSKVANTVLDIRKLFYPNEEFDVLICHHVLEHVVEDATAMKECFRVLKPNGIAFFSVPLDANRDQTWEPPGGMDAREVEKICGRDHVRLYGKDFAQKLEKVGFLVDLVSFDRKEGIKFRLEEKIDPATGEQSQGLDKIFVCRKR